MPAPYQQRVEEVVAAHTTEAVRGVGSAEARIRLQRDGPNLLAAERLVPRWRKVLAQCTDMLVVLLLIATAMSGAAIDRAALRGQAAITMLEVRASGTS